MEKYEKMKKLQQMAAIDPQPPKCSCNCKRKLDPYQLFDDNIEDIANSLAQIMLICGINTTKCYNAKPIIKRAFVYHEKMRTKCPPEPDRAIHLNRDDMLQALLIKCDMQRVEAMLSYAIIKRAFKAFFHGKPPTTISNPIVDAMAIHGQESAWLHAAYKTARIFDNYRAAFFWAHKSYEKQINLVYRNLFRRMRTRADPMQVPTCKCRGCSKQEVPGSPKPAGRDYTQLKLAECDNLLESCIVCGLQLPKMKTNGKVKVKPPRPIINHELNMQRCEKCNSPFLICECNIDPLTGEQFGECGQDSYKVKWYRVEQEAPNLAGSEEAMTDEKSTTDWLNHHCPIDCRHGSSSDSSDVCHEQRKTESGAESETEFTSCTGEEQDIVAKLEEYLNQLWAEEVAAKKNPKTYKPTMDRKPRASCQRN
ncbi:uncharacterized protein LOC115628340 [Scaptodrosophila lebanonensis]|uniref:Uncharacterized protein LOC115628340 n=1 Tax=Drosophila lebanonensis TaxID=7225 RepID=A0A6J2TYQ0_DROLE|nr:uncharacterized protein LOC115628340 [Scaptodrosophila lebanonensis]